MKTVLIIVGLAMILAGSVPLGYSVLYIMSNIMSAAPVREPAWLLPAIVGGGAAVVIGAVVLIKGMMTDDSTD